MERTGPTNFLKLSCSTYVLILWCGVELCLNMNPTNNALLITFLLDSDAEIFADRQRLQHIKGAAKHGENVYAMSSTTYSD